MARQSNGRNHGDDVVNIRWCGVENPPVDAWDVSWSQRVTWRVSGPTFLRCGEVTRGGRVMWLLPSWAWKPVREFRSFSVCACVKRGEAGWSWCRSRAVRWAEEEIDAEADRPDDACSTCLFTLSVLSGPCWKTSHRFVIFHLYWKEDKLVSCYN